LYSNNLTTFAEKDTAGISGNIHTTSNKDSNDRYTERKPQYGDNHALTQWKITEQVYRAAQKN